MSPPLPVAVIGVGYLGRFHAQKYQSLPQCKLAGVLDADPVRARAVGDEFQVSSFTDLPELLRLVKAVSVSASTAAHYSLVKQCLEAGVHVLAEKPLAATSGQARELVALAEQRGLILQVGYLERFNPAYAAARPRIHRPQFIEAIRIANFKERGIDVDVVLDLMSHDLDLILSMVNSPLVSLHAVGVSVLTPRTDLANARLVFQSGAVANLTASRISAKAERKLRIFQSDSYLSLDLAAPAAMMYAVERTPGNPIPNIRQDAPALEAADALLAEITAFVTSVREGTPPEVSGRDGLASIELAERISADIARNRMQ